jgi:hypothetical protein
MKLPSNLGSKENKMFKAKYFGWEFKAALTVAIHKIASDLGLSRVKVLFKSDIPTAAIDRQGNIYITNIADDAVLTRADLERFTGFALHELLHWKYTDFNAIDRNAVDYMLSLHNGLEDAFIENRAVQRKLTGNVEHLLATLIDNMATEGIKEVTDWSDPKQYPFVLAVYARKHGTVKVPLAKGLKPIFDEACRRLNACNDTHDTWKLAEWVFKELCKIQTPVQPEPPVQPPVNPKPPTGSDDGDPCDDGDPSDEEGGNKDGPAKGGNTPTSPDKEGDEVGDAKSPVKRLKERPDGTKVKVIVVPRSTEPTANVPEPARGGGSTGEWCMAEDAYHVSDTKKWTVNC